jgi:hypothetical protein
LVSSVLNCVCIGDMIQTWKIWGSSDHHECDSKHTGYVLAYIYIYTYIHYITSHHITLHYITSHHITLHYITLHYIALHYITSHYITLHTYIYIYTYIYICTVHCAHAVRYSILISLKIRQPQNPF